MQIRIKYAFLFGTVKKYNLYWHEQDFLEKKKEVFYCELAPGLLEKYKICLQKNMWRYQAYTFGENICNFLLHALSVCSFQTVLDCLLIFLLQVCMQGSKSERSTKALMKFIAVM